MSGTPVGCACGEGVVDWDRFFRILEPLDREIGLSIECGTIDEAERSQIDAKCLESFIKCAKRGWRALDFIDEFIGLLCKARIPITYCQRFFDEQSTLCLQKGSCVTQVKVGRGADDSVPPSLRDGSVDVCKDAACIPLRDVFKERGIGLTPENLSSFRFLKAAQMALANATTADD